MNEIIFLLVLAFFWILFASFQDIKKREIANWLSYSLIIFALGFRFFYSLFSKGVGWGFFYHGLIGLGIFFALGHLFYYSKLFAGGDAKLMISLGAVLPFSAVFSANVRILLMFLFLFLLFGAIYGFIWTVILGLKNFKQLKEEIKKQLALNQAFVYSITISGLLIIIFGSFINYIVLYFGILIFSLPYFYIFAKSVDEICMIKIVDTKSLAEGDWLYNDIKLGKNVIRANWDGLTKKDIISIRKKHKKIAIRQGIPFVPVFLISFLVLAYIWMFRPELMNMFL
ncbi:MAG TPA: prepilin peptidase [Candidatus Nanoarchaeia archaeon]|nr:prepilin peptidase [Candidatus Nanoarchaeia archaeon]